MRSIILSAVTAITLLTSLGASAVCADDDILLSGQFRGVSGHQTNGDVSVRETADGKVVVLEESFSFDGAPDPKLGFGKDGSYDKGSQFSALGSNSGRQVYKLPADVDPAAYNQVYVWCERYSVPLGVADLN
jgi:hypothetical protein